MAQACLTKPPPPQGQHQEDGQQYNKENDNTDSKEKKEKKKKKRALSSSSESSARGPSAITLPSARSLPRLRVFRREFQVQFPVACLLPARLVWTWLWAWADCSLRLVWTWFSQGRIVSRVRSGFCFARGGFFGRARFWQGQRVEAAVGVLAKKVFFVRGFAVPGADWTSAALEGRMPLVVHVPVVLDIAPRSPAMQAEVVSISGGQTMGVSLLLVRVSEPHVDSAALSRGSCLRAKCGQPQHCPFNASCLRHMGQGLQSPLSRLGDGILCWRMFRPWH